MGITRSDFLTTRGAANTGTLQPPFSPGDDRELEREENMRIKTATITTNYELSGPQNAPVVMLSHSLGSNLHMWDPQMTALEAKHQVLRYDTRGHGASDVPEGAYSLDQLIADAVALMDALEIKKASFVGLSMGGMIAQGLALRHAGRLDRLALCDTSAFMPPEAQPIVQERVDTARKEGMPVLVDSTLARWFTPSFLQKKGPGVDMIRNIFLASSSVGYIGCTEAIRRLNYIDQLARIKNPTLIIVGAEDPGTPVAAAQAIHERIAGSHLVVIPSASHLCNIEQAEVFNRSLGEFLATAGS
jgi:3-oxoadipate enol-lactonase